MRASISFSHGELGAFCRQREIRGPAFLVSARRDGLRPDGDVDVLVEFKPDRIPAPFGITRMEEEPSASSGGRKVHVRTPDDLDILWSAVEEGFSPLTYVLETAPARDRN